MIPEVGNHDRVVEHAVQDLDHGALLSAMVAAARGGRRGSDVFRQGPIDDARREGASAIAKHGNLKASGLAAEGFRCGRSQIMVVQSASTSSINATSKWLFRNVLRTKERLQVAVNDVPAVFLKCWK